MNRYFQTFAKKNAALGTWVNRFHCDGGESDNNVEVVSSPFGSRGHRIADEAV